MASGLNIVDPCCDLDLDKFDIDAPVAVPDCGWRDVRDGFSLSVDLAVFDCCKFVADNPLRLDCGGCSLVSALSRSDDFAGIMVFKPTVLFGLSFGASELVDDRGRSSGGGCRVTDFDCRSG